MNHSHRIGFCFGATSGIITTLGLMIGLYSGTQSMLVIIGGILTIAIADAFSDALGIHISEESENKHSAKEVWQSTLSTFFFKFVFSVTFIFPILAFQLLTAIIVSAVWGLSLLGVFSYHIAKKQNKRPFNVVMEHLVIAVVVIIITYFVGLWVGRIFG